DAELSRGPVECEGDDRNARPMGDAPEAGLPVLGPSAGALGGDPEVEGLTRPEALDRVLHAAGMDPPVDRLATEPAEDRARRPDEERVLRDPGDAPADGEHREHADREVPV